MFLDAPSHLTQQQVGFAWEVRAGPASRQLLWQVILHVLRLCCWRADEPCCLVCEAIYPQRMRLCPSCTAFLGHAAVALVCSALLGAFLLAAVARCTVHVHLASVGIHLHGHKYPPD